MQIYVKDFPLATPVEVMIDVSNLCNFRCLFCPTGDPELLESVGRPKGNMEFDLFCKIIDDIGKFNKRVKYLHLYKDGEPFLNKDLGRMIAYVKSKDIAVSVETTSNGVLIDETRAIEIIEAGLDRIRISVAQVNDTGYKNITQTYSDYKTIRKNVKFLYYEKVRRKSPLEINCKILDCGFSDTEINKFLDDFGFISDGVSCDTLMGWSLTDVKDFTLGLPIETGTDGFIPLNRNRKVCPTPFYTLAINFNGLVSVCCVDWSWGTIVGDVSRESLFDIWNGRKMKEFRILHLRGERVKIKPCANCHYIMGLNNQLGEIDGYSEYLLDKIVSSLC